MAVKCNPSIIRLFTGRDGKKRRLAAVGEQFLVASNVALAERIVEVGTLHEYSCGDTVMEQGECDNDLYMLLSGSVDIVINGRKISVREGGCHLGEMALLDLGARRSATAVAKEKIAVLKIAEKDVTKIAHDHPVFWRRLALGLAQRLRERSKYISSPNTIPRVFIGSSSEAITQAQCIAKSLGRRGFECRQWDRNVFKLSRTTIEDLLAVSQICDFAVLVLAPDDITSSRGQQKPSPRDNVVFELGLFMGEIGRHRTLIVAEEGMNIKLPTDLLGVTVACFNASKKPSLARSLASVTKVIAEHIKKHGPK